MLERCRRYMPKRKTLSVVLFVVSVVLTVCCMVELIDRLMTTREEVYASLTDILSVKWLLVAEVLLLLVNISLEALKWRIVNGHNYERFSWWRIYGTVLVATAFGGATPGRVGEHAARMQDGAGKSDALVGSMVSSLVQTIVIVVFALACVPLYKEIELLGMRHDVSYYALLAMVILLLLVGVAVALRYALLRWRNNVYTQRFTLRRLTAAFAVNALRYIVFTSQLVLLMVYDDMSLMAETFGVATLYYLFITFLPTINIIDIGVKNEVAILIFGALMPDAKIFTAVFVVWLLNTCLPSLLGLMVNTSTLLRRITSR